MTNRPNGCTVWRSSLSMEPTNQLLCVSYKIYPANQNGFYSSRAVGLARQLSQHLTYAFESSVSYYRKPKKAIAAAGYSAVALATIVHS